MGPEFLVEKGCEDQLLFCSNAPAMSAGAHRAYIDYADIPQSAKDKFANKNLTRLLKGLAPPKERINKNEDELMKAAREGKPLPTLVIDAHCHILDEGLHGGGQTNVMIDGGPKGVLKLANRMGVSAMGFMSWNGTVGLHADEGNLTTKAALDVMPPGCWGLASFDPFDSHETTRRKIAEVFQDKRFLGLKPYPHFNVAYDHPAFEPWWQFGNQHHLYALIHMTRWDFSELDNLCPKYPNITWVVAHCGGDYETADGAIARAKKFPNFRAEITLTPVPNGIIDYLAQGCGADKVLYGTDLPMRDPRQQFGWVVYSRLSLEDKRKVLGQNTQTLIANIRRFNQIPDPLQPST
jgi:predicted TIM-barrel fold metal-dependent hydrolase